MAHFDLVLDSVEDDETPSSKHQQIESKAKIFDAEDVFDGKEHKGNKSDKRKIIDTKTVYDRKEFEGNSNYYKNKQTRDVK